MRSRAVSFPLACCLAIFSAPPPWRMRSSSARTSSLSVRSRLTGRLYRLPLPLGEPLPDVLDQLSGRCAGAKEPAHPQLAERVHVLFRDDPAARQQDVVAPL